MSVSRTMGGHLVKAGGEFRLYRLFRQNVGNNNGQFDFSSTFTAVTTGEMNIVVSGAGAVWQATGRLVDTFYPNGDETLDFYGPHDPLVYFFLGDTSVADKLCAAFGA